MSEYGRPEIILPSVYENGSQIILPELATVLCLFQEQYSECQLMPEMFDAFVDLQKTLLGDEFEAVLIR